MIRNNTATFVELSNPLTEIYWGNGQLGVKSSNQTIRVGITGAQGVGKTILATALAQELRIPMIEEVARVVFQHGFPLGHDSTLLSQMAMWLTQFNLENLLDSYVADRMLFDVVVHSQLLAERSQSFTDQCLVNAIGNATTLLMRTHYTHIFYIPIEFELVGDGVRESSMEFQQILDEKTRALLKVFRLPYIELRGTIEKRLETAKQAIMAIKT